MINEDTPVGEWLKLPLVERYRDCVQAYRRQPFPKDRSVLEGLPEEEQLNQRRLLMKYDLSVLDARLGLAEIVIKRVLEQA
ncbi:Uncharacterised protein [uncultured archaeon]|nr:Uncharacterised protein [uncultured archaeon]